MRPTVFLDRDDTLIDNKDATAHTPTPGDLLDPALVRLLPGAGEACARLQQPGLQLVVITNQGGVAQGLCTLQQVEAVNDRLRQLLRGFGVELAGIYYSPNRPPPAGIVPRFSTPHPWRKPGPGMLLAAAADLNLDLPRSWCIGDAPRDVEAGVAAGLSPHRCLRIGPGLPLADLAAAADLILRSP
ncbi:MAG: HAD-IIIA family hydrolase [Phycisphaerales bacterium]|nr:HAD-IIIA family hydrolase [Phycisphaerales bacterium]